MRLFTLFFLTCMILPFRKEKLKLKLNIYSLPGQLEVYRGHPNENKDYIKNSFKKMRLYIRSINTCLKKLRKNLKQVIISAN